MQVVHGNLMGAAACAVCLVVFPPATLAAGPAIAFEPAREVALGGGGVGDRIIAGDFNGDGNPDLAVTPDLAAPEAFPNVDGVNVLFGDGLGDFPDGGAFLAGEYLTGIASGDFNRDGIADLVTAEAYDWSGVNVPIGLCNSTGPRVPVFLGAGNGLFTLQSPCLAAGRRPGAVATADFDEDGKLDLVATISSFDVNTVDRDTHFLAGNGDGSFAPGRIFPTTKSNRLLAADLDRDGHLDLVMPAASFLGSGRGTFAGTALAGGDAVGDIDGDGIPDLASIGANNANNAADDVVRIRLVQPGGSSVPFGLPLPTGANPAVESHPVAVAIADMNGDGYGDVIVANRLGDDVAVYIRDPAGTFLPRQGFAAGSRPMALAVADLNRDGHPDLAIPNYNPSADGTPGDGSVTLLIQQAAAKPAAADDTAITTMDTAVGIDVLANDADRSGVLDPASASVVRAPLHGTAVGGGNGVFTYTPAPGFSGYDSFGYTVSNTAGAASNVATASVGVARANKLPIAMDDAASTTATTAVAIAVLANDFDPDGTLDPASVTLATLPANGTATVDSVTGNIVYTPGAGTGGVFTVTYTVKDNNGAPTNTATVTITVTGGNLPPVAADDTAATTANTAVPIAILANDHDPEGSPLDRTKIAIVSPPAHGGVVVNTASGVVTYTPTPGYTGPDSFAYTVPDTRGAVSNKANVAITVKGVPGDLDGDGDADRADLYILLANLRRVGTVGIVSVAVSCGAACDLDGNGRIDALDARTLITRCTRPGCAM